MFGVIRAMLTALAIIHKTTFHGNVKPENVFLYESSQGHYNCTLSEPYHDRKVPRLHSNMYAKGFPTLSDSAQARGKKLDLWCLGQIILEIIESARLKANKEAEQTDTDSRLNFLVQFLRARVLVLNIPSTAEAWLAVMKNPRYPKCQCGQYVFDPCLLIHKIDHCPSCLQVEVDKFRALVIEEKIPFDVRFKN